LCGNIGVKFGGINPLRGQNNVQGSCDMGGLPDSYPGYQKVYNKDVKAKFEKEWKVELCDRVGYTIPEMMHRAGHGDLKCLYIMGENPMVSDPDINHIKHSLETLDFLIVQDIFLTETAELAHVVLPALSFAEKDGTFTNTERRVQRVRKVVDREGVKPDWKIINNIMNVLGYEGVYNGPEEISAEMARLTPQYEGLTYELIEKIGVAWPINKATGEGTPILHIDKPMRGKGMFVPSEQELLGENPTAEYPYLMTNGRNLYHYHTRTMTGRVDGLNEKSPESYIEINPETMRKLDVTHGEMIKVISRRGEIVTKVTSNEGILQDLFFMPFHFAEGA
ncbi:MAG: molybdopterin oxidoreductase family protein, partial [Cetobacterium sp.]